MSCSPLVLSASLSNLSRFDRTLAQAINVLQSDKPRAIGLDLLRDIPQEPGHTEFLAALNAPNVSFRDTAIGQAWALVFCLCSWSLCLWRNLVAASALMKKLSPGISVSPTGLVLFAIGSIQFGAAIAKLLLAETSPAGIVLLRVGFAAIVLFCLWRPRLSDRVYANRWLLIAFGGVLALMNLSFYTAIERIPLGIAVALEFIGPLGLALAHSRRWLDGLWVLLAGTGIILLTPLAGVALDPLGIGLALIAGVCWAAYILLSARTGKVLEGGEGLAWAMAIAALLLLPIGAIIEGTALLQPHLLLMGFGVALLSSAIPYSLELAALQKLSVQVFGILLSLEPVAAALAALLILQERLAPQAIAAILMITLAAAGSSYFAPRRSHQNER